MMSSPDRLTGPKVEVVHSALPYAEIEYIVVEPVPNRVDAGLSKAPRTLTYLERYQLREIGRSGDRLGHGIVANIREITGRTHIGKQEKVTANKVLV